MRRSCKALLSAVLSFSMVWGIVTPDASVANAAKAVKLSSKTIAVTVGKTKTVKVKNTKKTVKWSVKKGSKYISLTKKKKLSVTVKGKKAGKATVQAKVGSKKPICKVTVKKAVIKATAAPTSAATTAPTTAPTASAAPTKAPATPSPTPDATKAPTETAVPSAPAATDAQPSTEPTATAPAGEEGDAVKDVSIDLSGLEASFTGTPCKIDFSSQIESRMNLSYFDKMEVTYETVFENDDSTDWKNVKLAVATGQDTLNGFDNGVAYVYATSTGKTETVDLSGATISGTPVGINVQPMNASYSWPAGLTSITVTSIKFIAKTGAVYPPAGATPEPTQEPLATYEPREFTYEGIDQDWIDTNIDPSKPMVAFTFDDGPVGTADTDTSMIIQKELYDNGCHATFNYIGGVINSEEKENEIKQAYDYGFEIGNHSWAWSSMSSMQDDAIRESIGDTNAKLSELTGGKISNFTFRPPNLAVGGMMIGNIDAPFISCAVDSKDWAGVTTEQLINNVELNAQDGDIILMHETQATTAEAMPELIKFFKDQGWQIVSVSELFHIRNTPLQTGKVYKNCPPANN